MMKAGDTEGIDAGTDFRISPKKPTKSAAGRLIGAAELI
jgi:hypothetical protein